jgi:hypothetical protein
MKMLDSGFRRNDKFKKAVYFHLRRPRYFETLNPRRISHFKRRKENTSFLLPRMRAARNGAGV